ncbi:hypothetical protein RM530_02920 [Algiphilus sp. W345]|uniref:Uncharacterized protein n=1 Tax=Banduia mediterranea TaxID=3075609 RepID=A0ABU2WEN5_9GAMM|nr:hypothetical protein [Algiphilus sp. W345]MDT0496320.1 hypothetical protein [Algiphilus sp. W345]
MRAASLAFAAGAVGALLNSLAVWAAGHYGLTARIGVAIHPSFSAAWLYPRIVWGGLWGLLLLLPLAPGRTLIRGLVVSLGPSLAQLLFFFPQQTSHGLGGLGLGLLTPAAVLIFNAIWGISAAYWIRSTGR